MHKDLTLLFILAFAGICKLHAQTEGCNYSSITNLARGATNYYKASPSLFQEVKFSTGISNNLITPKETNFLHCRLYNGTTNIILCQSVIFACLTNSSSGCYQISPVLEPPETNSGPKITFVPKNDYYLIKVNAGQVREWDLSFVIGTNLHFGEYEIRASQGVVTGNGRFSWELTANTLKVKIE
jgi:hypothetical protein